ncbi:DUF7009 family protein [Mucilaginibacter aquariorum]|uniref:Uncharacterized protein n=1 Tax=Mucilaginibacter aquariorum TaxID=2967225 RepID=A0ABT1SWM5_9SPHI|nr:hypothetical protein [Mucilaginibacter aquariorum]MCQ6956756.1 hypothetical protein [Mucilaginibacter aquariorum]
MKIRIKNNGLRYRLTRSEVEAFALDGVFKEKIQIGDDALTYVLQRTVEEVLSASFKNNIITMLVPEKMADEWTGTDQVGFEHKTNDLHLLVEKDFTCLDNVDEDQSDNYPNPLAAKS